MKNLLNKPVNTVGDVVKIQLAECGISMAISLAFSAAIGCAVMHKAKKLEKEMNEYNEA